MNTGIICACMPPLQPLIRRLFPALMGSASRSRDRSGGYRRQYYEHSGAGGGGLGGGAQFSHEYSASASNKPRNHSQNGIVVTQELRLESAKYPRYGYWEESESERGLVLRDMP